MKTFVAFPCTRTHFLPQPNPGSHLRSSIGFIWPVCLASLTQNIPVLVKHLAQCLSHNRCSQWAAFLYLLRHWYFSRVSFNPFLIACSFGVSSWLDWDYAFSARAPHRWCVFFRISSWRCTVSECPTLVMLILITPSRCCPISPLYGYRMFFHPHLQLISNLKGDSFKTTQVPCSSSEVVPGF